MDRDNYYPLLTNDTSETGIDSFYKSFFFFSLFFLNAVFKQNTDNIT